ncbi:MAG: ComF family protein [Desulfobaccales bacterium]
MWLRHFSLNLLNFFLPRLCVFCGAVVAEEARAPACPACEAAVTWVASPLCPVCGRVYEAGVGADHLCGPCQTDPPPFERARAAVLYDEDGPSGRAIKGLKYNRRLDMLPVMHQWLRGPQCLELVAEADLVAPVPLHPKRLRQRGFNQALLLAQTFPGATLERELLVRVRHTPPQTGLNPKERRENVKGAFAVPRPDRVKDKKVLLLDDVFTTGSTVKECTRVLRRAGARRVDVLTVARVRPE